MVCFVYSLYSYRHTVQYVANHWTNYKTWRLEVCRDSEDTVLPGSDPQKEITLQKIQLEVDEMFFRAVQCIMSAPRYTLIIIIVSYSAHNTLKTVSMRFTYM